MRAVIKNYESPQIELKIKYAFPLFFYINTNLNNTAKTFSYSGEA